MTFAPLVLRWRLAPGISLVPSGATDLTLNFADGPVIVLTPGHERLCDALLALASGADEAALMAAAGGERAAQLYYYLARMAGRGMLEASADLDGTPAIRLLPHNAAFELPLPSGVPSRVALDRFAFLRRDERGATLQHPDAACDLLVDHPAAAALIARLAAGPVDADGWSPLERSLTAVLVSLGFAVDVAMAEEPSRRTWEFHDRLFHRAARSDADRAVRGASYRFIGALPCAAGDSSGLRMANRSPCPPHGATRRAKATACTRSWQVASRGARCLLRQSNWMWSASSFTGSRA